MKPIIATPTATQAYLTKYQLTAKKGYGQNFLIDPHIVDKIARHAVISDHCAVLEIGPGIGALTQCLCRYAKQVVAYEIDSRLPEVLADSLSDCDNFTLRQEDFLTVDVAAAVKDLADAGYDVAVAANLPYYITTPILFKLFESQAPLQAITVMMQKEVADRFNAGVNSAEYNALSVITQYRCEVIPVMNVSRNVFLPKPKVDSRVLQFRFRTVSPDIDETKLFALIKACFRQRRKTILNNYGEYLGNNKEKAREILTLADIDPGVRAQNLGLEQFLRLYEVSR